MSTQRPAQQGSLSTRHAIVRKKFGIEACVYERAVSVRLCPLTPLDRKGELDGYVHSEMNESDVARREQERTGNVRVSHRLLTA